MARCYFPQNTGQRRLWYIVTRERLRKDLNFCTKNNKKLHTLPELNDL